MSFHILSKETSSLICPILLYSILVYFDTVEDATLAVENGEAWGVIRVGKDFSENLFEVI